MAANWQKGMNKAQKQWMEAWSSMAKQAMGGGMMGAELPKNPFDASAYAGPFKAWMEGLSQLYKTSFSGGGVPGGFPFGGAAFGTNPFQMGSYPFQMGDSAANPFQMGSFAGFNPFQWSGQSTEGNPYALGDGFKTLTDGVMAAFANLGKGAAGTKEWTKMIAKSVESAKTFYGNPENAAAAAAFMTGWTDQFMGQSPLSMLSSLSPFADKLQGGLDSILSMPGLGPNREAQERYQEGLKNYIDFQQAYTEQMTMLTPVVGRSLDLLKKRLIKTSSDGKPTALTSMQLYALWVDCGEEAYEDVVSDKKFNEVNARLTNALNRLKIFQQGIMNAQLAEMNMPTRVEVDTSHKRMMELKKTVKELESEVALLKGQEKGDEGGDLEQVERDIAKLKDSTDVRTLKKEIAALKKQMENRPLRREFDALKKQLDNLTSAAVVAPVAKKKPAARKTAASKKTTKS